MVQKRKRPEIEVIDANSISTDSSSSDEPSARLKRYLNYNSGVESINSERASNYALGFADTRFFQGLHGFYLRRGIGS